MFQMRVLLVLLIVLFQIEPADAAFNIFQTQATSSGDPTSGVLETANDVYANWKNAGLVTVGGISANEPATQCGSTLTPIGGSSDDYTNIQNAINACPVGEYVLLGSGTFNVMLADLPIQISKGIVLRGSGSCTNGSSPYCQTTIQVYNGLLAYTSDNCGVSLPGSACPNGGSSVVLMSQVIPAYNYSWAQCGNAGSGTVGSTASNCGAAILEADATQGQTTVQVNSTTGFTVGMFVLIDEASGGTWETDPIASLGLVWAAPDAFSSSPSPATGRVVWEKHDPVGSEDDFGSLTDFPFSDYTGSGPGCQHSYCDRVTSEIHKVSAVGAGPCPGTNCTLTFDDPLTTAFRQSGGTSVSGYISGTTVTCSTSCVGVVAGQPIVEVNTPTAISAGSYITACSPNCTSPTSLTVSNSQTVGSSGSPVSLSVGAHNAQVYIPYANQSGTGSPLAFTEYAGLENLSITRGPNSDVQMSFCAYCWLNGVELSDWYNGGIDVAYSIRSEITGSYLGPCWDSVNSGGEYSFANDYSSTEILVDNNSDRLGGKGMVGRTGTAAVVAYNYIDDSMYDLNSSVGDYWRDNELNGSHYAGPHHFLFEGNWAATCGDDFTHGNTMYHTYYRNWCTGFRTQFVDPSNGKTVIDTAGQAWGAGASPTGRPPTPLRAFGEMPWNYWVGSVGNVLGESGQSVSGNGWVDTSDSYPAQTGAIWLLGWIDWNTSLDDANFQGATPWIFRHANYDYFSSSISYASGYSHTLPSSFYLSSAPPQFSEGIVFVHMAVGHASES